MDSWSIYNHMKLGIVHFKAFPEARDGDKVADTLAKILEDDFWTAVEVGMVRDIRERNRVRMMLETAHIEVAYATQPKVLGGKLNLNSLDKAERRKAISGVKSCVDEAFDLGASVMRILSGKDPGDKDREEAKKILIDSFSEIIEYAGTMGEMKFRLKVFDRDIDKKALIGHFSDAADVAKPLAAKYPNFGLLSDLSHFPLLQEDPKDALEKVKQYPLDFHIGNCAMRDKLDPAYGDLQPRFGYKGGEQDTEDVRKYFQLLKNWKLIGPEKKPILSVEVRPLLQYETSELIIVNAKRVIKEAWAAVE